MNKQSSVVLQKDYTHNFIKYKRIKPDNYQKLYHHEQPPIKSYSNILYPRLRKRNHSISSSPCTTALEDNNNNNNNNGSQKNMKSRISKLNEINHNKNNNNNIRQISENHTKKGNIKRCFTEIVGDVQARLPKYSQIDIKREQQSENKQLDEIQERSEDSLLFKTKVKNYKTINRQILSRNIKNTADNNTFLNTSQKWRKDQKIRKLSMFQLKGRDSRLSSCQQFKQITQSFNQSVKYLHQSLKNSKKRIKVLHKFNKLTHQFIQHTPANFAQESRETIMQNQAMLLYIKNQFINPHLNYQSPLLIRKGQEFRQQGNKYRKYNQPKITKQMKVYFYDKNCQNVQGIMMGKSNNNKSKSKMKTEG